jgi:hypothetical protein
MNKYYQFFKIQFKIIVFLNLFFVLTAKSKFVQTDFFSEGMESDSSAYTIFRAPTYCSSGGNATQIYGIKRVVFNTIDNSSATNTSYTNYTATKITSIKPGLSYNISAYVDTRPGVGAYTFYQRVWIDWNQDGVFNNTTEQYNIGTVYNNSNGLSNLCPYAITVPADATPGTTRMRITSRYNLYAAPCDAVSSFSGETEDYGITVLNPPGASYGIYAPGAISGISDCEIYAQGGSGTGGCLVCSPTDAGYANVEISSFPIITATNIACTNKNITVATAASSPSWTGSTTPLTGSGASKTVQYTTTGRKDIMLTSGGAASTWTDNFESSTGWTFSGINPGGIGSIPANCIETCVSNSYRSGTKVLYLQGCDYNETSIAQITLTLGTGGGTFSGYYKIGSKANHYFSYKIDGGAATNIGSGCLNTWTAFSFAVSAGTHTITLQYIMNNQFREYGSKVIIEDVQCTNISSSTTTNYTGFTNMMMIPPSSGTITGTANGCPDS